MNGRIRSAIALFVLCQASHAAGAPYPPEHLRIHGAGVLADTVVPELVQQWLKETEYTGITKVPVDGTRVDVKAKRGSEEVVIEIVRSGTTAGLDDLVKGQAEICMSARRPNEAEVGASQGDLIGSDQEWVVALDGRQVLVSPGNPISQLSVAQVRSILGGKVRDWNALGTRAGAIRIHRLRAEAQDKELPDLVAIPAATNVQWHESEATLVAAVAADPNGLGLLPLKAAAGEAKALAIDAGGRAVAPDPLSLRSEDYPLQWRLYFHTQPLVTALGRGFLVWALSEPGQAVVERTALVPVDVRVAPGKTPADAPPAYLKIVEGGKRIPTTLRFAARGLDLFDSRSRADLERVSTFLHRPENRDRRLVVIAFTNPNPNDPLDATWLADQRAELVASELRRMDNRVTRFRGMGGALPLVDPTQPGARLRNERVELWLQ